jgi:hypothetical protein
MRAGSVIGDSAERVEVLVMVPETVLARWESAYRRYGQASKLVAASPAGDREATQQMAATSSELAAVWREMESAPDLAWWVLAAVGAAAQAFEAQARDWSARVEHGRPEDGARPQVRLVARPRHADRGSAR